MQRPPLRERYTFIDFLYYMTLVAVPAFTACYAIAKHSMVWLIFYLVLCIAAGIVLLRFYCTHCPHYTRESQTIRCMFMWGIPKYFVPRPGPLSLGEKAVALIAPTILVVFPLSWLLQQPGLMVIFILSLVALLSTVRKNECRRCIYFDCPVNKAPEELKSHDDAA
jgi:hypothetical protein